VALLRSDRGSRREGLHGEVVQARDRSSLRSWLRRGAPRRSRGAPGGWQADAGPAARGIGRGAALARRTRPHAWRDPARPETTLPRTTAAPPRGSHPGVLRPARRGRCARPRPRGRRRPRAQGRGRAAARGRAAEDGARVRPRLQRRARPPGATRRGAGRAGVHAGHRHPLRAGAVPAGIPRRRRSRPCACSRRATPTSRSGNGSRPRDWQP